jgi:transmembrane sensor
MHNADDLHEHDWENFQPDPNEPVPTQKMREHIEGHVGRPPVRTIALSWVAAASVIAVLAGIAGLEYWKTEKPPVVATAANTQKEQPQAATARQVITNSTSATQLFSLPDGSKVRLSKGSSIAFDRGRTARRDIALTGEAVFTVAHDKTRPFTVHSKDLAVTALGTVFGVDDTHNAFTTVLLYSGKVVVKKAATGVRGFSDVYLAPGQQLTVNRNDWSVSIRMALPAPSGTERQAAPAARQLMTFTRQPLTEIFNELHNAYHITISYDTAAVKNIDFTGTFNSEKESLESFLSTLCDLNELTLKKTKDKGFSIQPR